MLTFLNWIQLNNDRWLDARVYPEVVAGPLDL